MEPRNLQLRNRLLSLDSTDPIRFERYRKELKMTLLKEEKSVKRWTFMVNALWIFISLLTTVFLVIGGSHPEQYVSLYYTMLACFWLAWGMAFFIPMVVNKSRFEVLKEIKGLELRILELQERIKSQPPG